ncbi:MAG: glycosyltransferase family 9 protein [Candidatus Neomarinimicrobiota bacterium]
MVLRFSSIGDIVQTTSVIGTLKKKFPKSRIDYMTLSKYSSILLEHPYINTIHEVDIKSNYKDLKNIAIKMNDLNYDLVLDMHNTTRSKIIRRFIKNSNKHFIRKPRWNRFKNFALHLNHFPKNFSVRIWMNEILDDLSNEKLTPSKTKLVITKEEMTNSNLFIQSNVANKPYFSILPGAAWPQKSWLFDRYISVIEKCIKNYDLCPILIGSSTDTICEKIKNVLGEVLVDLHGKTSLRQSIAIISQSKFVIGGDTGLVHAAEALDIPTISILGPTTMETGAGLFNEKSIIVEDKNLWCRPCSQNGSIPCFRNEQYCMTNINIETVMNAVNGIMQ